MDLLSQLIVAVVGAVLGAAASWAFSVYQQRQETKEERKRKLLHLSGLLDKAKTIFDAWGGLVGEINYRPTDPVARTQLSEFIDQNARINEAIEAGAIERPYPDAVNEFSIYANYLKTEVANGKTERWGTEITFPKELDDYVDRELEKLNKGKA